MLQRSFTPKQLESSRDRVQATVRRMEKSASEPNDSGAHDSAHPGWVKVVRNPASPWVKVVNRSPGWGMVVRNDDPAADLTGEPRRWFTGAWADDPEDHDPRQENPRGVRPLA